MILIEIPESSNLGSPVRPHPSMSSSHVHLTPTAPSFASQSESENHHDSAAAAAETVLSVQHVSSHMCSLIILMKSARVMVNWECGVNRVSLLKCALAIERHADTNFADCAPRPGHRHARGRPRRRAAALHKRSLRGSGRGMEASNSTRRRDFSC